MRFTVAAVFTLAIGAMAAPSSRLVGKGLAYPGGGDVTVAQARDTCGKDLTMSCCNEVHQTSDTNSADGGLLNGLGQGGLLPDFSLLKGCSKLDVAALIGVQDLIPQKMCNQQVACCQGTAQDQNGLVNVGIPCIAVGGVL
ncbi:hypothetical protein F5B22DRAFT_645752 [Xylaria bambusicola]|uniref:uncharacterized protein n=1 Tax=Xylaria bambusicola TaxID=326684 RepID=UPI0020081FAA|nr:uncharacterized protein F5B22DRAFT_645752 [Xylaria bambusicola]KAI0517571.1 hypothetical protein F5B22DRAFT_645752 [Xylaria bambusicola]